MVALVLLLGCGDNSPLAPDATIPDTAADAPQPAGPCWFDPPYTPAGAITLGAGPIDYEPMPDMPQLEPPGQQIPFFDLAVNAQIKGLIPGDPIDSLDPHNPRTRFTGFFVDTGESIFPGGSTCGVRLGYKKSGWITNNMVRGTPLTFAANLTGADLFGRQVRVVVEIIDANMHYATDEKIVTLQPPP